MDSKLDKVLLLKIISGLVIVGGIFFALVSIRANLQNKRAYTGIKKVDNGRNAVQLGLKRDNFSNSLEGTKEYVDRLSTIQKENPDLPEYLMTLVRITKVSQIPSLTLATWSKEREKSFIEAYDELHVIFDENLSRKTVYQEEVYTRAVLELENLAQASSFNATCFNKTSWAKSTEYVNILAKNKDKNPRLVMLLYLEELFNSKNILVNKTTISTHMLVLSLMLANFPDAVDTSLKSIYSNTLHSLADSYDTAKDNTLYAKTYTGKNTSYFRDQVYYMYGIDVASRSKHRENSSSVTKMYENTLEDLKKENEKENYVYNMLYIDLLSYMYIGHLYQIGDNYSLQKIDSIVIELEERFKILPKEVLVKENIYLGAINRTDDKWDDVRTRLGEAAKKSNKLKTFLRERGALI